MGGAATDRLYPQVTISALPDNVLLEIFELYLGKDDFDYIIYGHNYDGWQMLAHVCHRWRCVVLASPRRLDLKLYCTPQRSEKLDIWPELPIVMDARDIHSEEHVPNISVALRHHNRVCKIRSFNEDFLWKEFAAIDKPFPALTCLRLYSFRPNVLVLPDSFLGGSAPLLRSLYLDGIPYPSIGKLLSSTTNLVQLSLLDIPHPGYVSPEMIVPILSTLFRLNSLELGFRYPRSRAHRANQHPPRLTRLIFPSLTYLHFHGDIEYFEDVLSHIETPILNQCIFRLFNQLVFDTPLLGHFIRRTETFMTINRAHVEFSRWGVEVKFWGHDEMNNSDDELLDLHIA